MPKNSEIGDWMRFPEIGLDQSVGKIGEKWLNVLMRRFRKDLTVTIREKLRVHFY